MDNPHTNMDFFAEKWIHFMQFLDETRIPSPPLVPRHPVLALNFLLFLRDENFVNDFLTTEELNSFEDFERVTLEEEKDNNTPNTFHQEHGKKWALEVISKIEDKDKDKFIKYLNLFNRVFFSEHKLF
jgi:hypothetical protein